MGARSGAQADRLRHVGHRLQVRGGHRARADAGRDAGRPARRVGAVLHDGHRQPRQAADRAHRPDGADLPDGELLRRPAGCARSAAAGRALRVFGDRFQISKVVGGQRYWRVPVMEGECLLSGKLRRAEEGRRRRQLPDSRRGRGRALAAAEAAVTAIDGTPGVILPFPGGIVRSGSKVGARRYKGMIASTNDAYCPTLRPLTPVGAAGRRQFGARDRARRPRAPTAISRGDARRHRRRLPPRRPRDHAPATTAASSGRITSICVRSWAPRERAPFVCSCVNAVDEPIDVDGLTPDRLASLSEREIAGLPVWAGRQRARLGDFFQVRGEHAAIVRVEGLTRHVHGVAAHMAGGELVIDGEAGDGLALEMSGGSSTCADASATMRVSPCAAACCGSVEMLVTVWAPPVRAPRWG